MHKDSCYVHYVNDRRSQIEPYKSLKILDELSKNDVLTQRDLSDRLGLALGLINSYIKNLVVKGFITVKAIPPKRYSYYLTPKGFAEKTRLAYDLLQDYTRIYREAKNSYRTLFTELKQAGMQRVLFSGADEVAEFAYITLQEMGLQLAGVIDNEKAGEKFFGMDIRSSSDIKDLSYDTIVITSYVRRTMAYNELMNAGVNKSNIRTIFRD